MAKLPSDADLGAIPSPHSSRPIATYDATGFAKGAAALASGAVDLGRGLQSAGKDVAALALAEQKQAGQQALQDRLQAARARSEMAVEHVTLRNETSKEIPSAELPERHRIQLLAKSNALQEGFLSPEAGNAFAMANEADIAQAAAEVQAETEQRYGDVRLADWTTRSDSAIAQAAASPDEQARVRVIDSFRDELDEIARAYPAIQPQVPGLQQKFVQDYTRAWGMARVQIDPAGVRRDIEDARTLTAAWPDEPMHASGESSVPGAGNPYIFLRKEQQDELADHAERNMHATVLTKASERSAQLKQELQAAAMSVPGARLPDRSVIETDPVLLANPVLHAELLRRYDEAEAEVSATRKAIEMFLDPTFRYNRYDPSHRDAAELMFRWLGGTPIMLQPIVDRTGMVPTGVYNRIRGALTSQDPKEVQAALTLATSLLTNNGQIFRGVKDGHELESVAEWYRREVQVRNKNEEEVTQQFMEKYRAKQNSPNKTEALDPRVEKLTADDLADAFGDWWPWLRRSHVAGHIGLMRNPLVGFTGEQREELLAHFKALTNEYLMNSVHGDLDISMTLAAKQLGLTWGVSNVNGSRDIRGGGVLMMYPPEHAPAVRGVKNAPKRIADAAAAAIKQLTGEDVDRGSVVFEPIPGRTAQAYFTGEPVPYRLRWQDKNGKMRSLPEFSFDHVQAHTEDSAEREKEFYEARENKKMWDDISLRNKPSNRLTPERLKEKEAAIARIEARKKEAAEKRQGDRAEALRLEMETYGKGGSENQPGKRSEGDKSTPPANDEQQSGSNLLAPVERPKNVVVTPGSPELTVDGVIAAGGAALQKNSKIVKFFYDDDHGLSRRREEGFAGWKRIVGTPYERYWQHFVEIENTEDFEKRKRQVDREIRNDKALHAVPGYVRLPLEFAAGMVDVESAAGGALFKHAIKPAGKIVTGMKMGAAESAAHEATMHLLGSAHPLSGSIEHIIMGTAAGPAKEFLKEKAIGWGKRRLGIGAPETP